jgi:hypothetical protein
MTKSSPRIVANCLCQQEEKPPTFTPSLAVLLPQNSKDFAESSSWMPPRLPSHWQSTSNPTEISTGQTGHCPLTVMGVIVELADELG